MPREKVSGWQPRSIRVDVDDWKALEAEAARLRKTTKVCMSPSGLARLAIAKFCEELSSEVTHSDALALYQHRLIPAENIVLFPDSRDQSHDD